MQQGAPMNPRTTAPVSASAGSSWQEWLSLVGYAGAVALAVSGALAVAVVLFSAA